MTSLHCETNSEDKYMAACSWLSSTFVISSKWKIVCKHKISLFTDVLCISYITDLFVLMQCSYCILSTIAMWQSFQLENFCSYHNISINYECFFCEAALYPMVLSIDNMKSQAYHYKRFPANNYSHYNYKNIPTQKFCCIW